MTRHASMHCITLVAFLLFCLKEITLALCLGEGKFSGNCKESRVPKHKDWTKEPKHGKHLGWPSKAKKGEIDGYDG